MDINEFIDQDILIFLDDRLDNKNETSKGDLTTPTVFLTRDYEKELTTALHNDAVSVAKQVLHDLKEQLDTCPPGTDKERLKALLLTLYDQFKEYIDAHHLSLEDPSLGLKKAEQTGAEAPADPLSKEARTAITALAQEIDTALAAGMVHDAMLTYRRAKQEIITWPSVPTEIILQFIAFFERIKQAARQNEHAKQKGQIAQQKEQAAAETAPEPATSASVQLDHALILQLEHEKQKLDSQLHQGDIRSAMEQYRRMRLIVQQIADQDSRASAAEKLQRIFEIITAVKQHSSDRKLARNMP